MQTEKKHTSFLILSRASFAFPHENCRRLTHEPGCTVIPSDKPHPRTAELQLIPGHSVSPAWTSLPHSLQHLEVNTDFPLVVHLALV